MEDADSLRKAGIRAKEHTELMKIEREGYTSVMESWKRRTAPYKIKFLLNTGLFRGWSKEELFEVASASACATTALHRLDVCFVWKRGGAGGSLTHGALHNSQAEPGHVRSGDADRGGGGQEGHG